MPRETNIISIDKCALKYNLGKNTLYVRRSNGSLPAHIFKSKKNCNTLIDEHYIYRRVEFRKKIVKTIQDVYYELSESMSDYALAIKLYKMDNRVSKEAWANFIYRDMFRNREPNRLILNIYKKEWKFFKYSKLILREVRNGNK